MAWDRDALSARSGDASKRPQWLADTLRVLQTSAFDGKRSFASRDEKQPAVYHLAGSRQQLPKQQPQVERADERKRTPKFFACSRPYVGVEQCVSFSLSRVTGVVPEWDETSV